MNLAQFKMFVMKQRKIQQEEVHRELSFFKEQEAWRRCLDNSLKSRLSFLDKLLLTLMIFVSGFRNSNRMMKIRI